MDEFLLKRLIERCLHNEHPAFRPIVEHFQHRFIVLDSHETELPASENIETDLIAADLGAIISKLVEQLTPKQQIVFTLRYLEGMETDEIIQITRMSGAKIKSNLFLARKTIREKLEKLI